jgi:hypothetical protein
VYCAATCMLSFIPFSDKILLPAVWHWTLLFCIIWFYSCFGKVRHLWV